MILTNTHSSRYGTRTIFTRINSEELWRRTKVANKESRRSSSVSADCRRRNIYADEALFYAGINPSLDRLPRSSRKILQSLQMVLSQAIDMGGTTLRDYRNLNGGLQPGLLHCYGRSGCPAKCGSVLDPEQLTPAQPPGVPCARNVDHPASPSVDR